MDENIILASVYEKQIQLKNKNFIVPNYQRGFRWTANEIEKLLNDFLDFENGKMSGNFYCL